MTNLDGFVTQCWDVKLDRQSVSVLIGTGSW